MTLGERLIALRRIRGWSGRRLAKESGVGNGTISEIENGIVKSPQMDTVEKLARALGVLPSQLLGENEEELFKTPTKQLPPLTPEDEQAISILARVKNKKQKQRLLQIMKAYLIEDEEN